MPALAAAVRVGDPLTHESMTVFPLFHDLDAAVDYIPSEEALDSGDLLVEYTTGSQVTRVKTVAEYPALVTPPTRRGTHALANE